MKRSTVVIIFCMLLTASAAEIKTGAQDLKAYLPLLHGRSVALVVNHSSMVDDRHLVDLLLEKRVSIKTVFAPEHGLHGSADAGEKVKDSVDLKNALSIVSLYGEHKKPTKKDLEGVDVIIFDIQDVGVRFYTYLSTLHFVMEAAAENDLPLIVLDRPNPNGDRIDGPLLRPKFSSFVGMHPVPVLYGMTIGEYALMINGESWLDAGKRAELHVVALQGYSHGDLYHLPIRPSPNLPNDLSIALYPSLGLLEGTHISVGRGTKKQFQLYGAPKYSDESFFFIPVPQEGAKYPKHQGEVCYGVDLSDVDVELVRASKKLDLKYLLDAFKNYPDKKSFFLKNDFFDRLAGSDRLRRQILEGKSEELIRSDWKADISEFKRIRSKYLLYP